MDPNRPREGACLRFMMNGNRPMKGMFKTFEAVCSRYIIYDEPQSLHEGACLGCMMNRNRQMVWPA